MFAGTSIAPGKRDPCRYGASYPAKQRKRPSGFFSLPAKHAEDTGNTRRQKDGDHQDCSSSIAPQPLPSHTNVGTRHAPHCPCSAAAPLALTYWPSKASSALQCLSLMRTCSVFIVLNYS